MEETTTNVTDAVGKFLMEQESAVNQYREGLITGEELSNWIVSHSYNLLDDLPIDHDPRESRSTATGHRLGNSDKYPGCIYGAGCRYIGPKSGAVEGHVKTRKETK